MKALRIHGPKDLRYEELPDRPLGPDEALLAPKAVGICGTDLEIFQGTMFYFTAGMAKWPVILGHEWSAEVLAVGENVTEVKPGDKVVGECTVSCGHCEMCRLGRYNECPNRRETGILNLDGAFSDRMYYPASFLHKFEKISYDEAALTEPTAVAVWGTKLVEVNPSDYVAVMGPGPIGLLAMQVARAYGRISLMGLFNSQMGSIDLDALVVGNITIKGSLGSPGVWDETISLIERGHVNTKALITHPFALADVPQAFDLMQDRTSDVVKICLKP